MTPESVMMMGTEAMKVALALAAPLLLVALVTGLIISILQAATQINEMTLSFIPKIIAVFIAIIIAGPWMLNLFDAPRDKCALSCAINGIHAAFHYLKKNYISGCVMTVPTG